MEVRQFTKRLLTIGAFRFDAAETLRRLGPGQVRTKVGLATLKWQGKDVWHVYNPGRTADPDVRWKRVKDGDYVIIAPTGCRYPVQANEFERNYAKVVHEAGPTLGRTRENA